MRRICAVIFDLDDTLYPERDFVLSGFAAVARWAEKHLGIPSADSFSELKELFERGIRGQTFNLWLRRRGHSEALVAELVRVYRSHKPRLRPFPEVFAILESLAHRYELGLVTDGTLHVQKRKLAALGIAHFFRSVVFSDRWGPAYWKPHPKPFRAVLAELQVSAAEAVYVGDNPTKDFHGARALGLFTVQIVRKKGLYSQLVPPTLNHRPDFAVESLRELQLLLEDFSLNRESERPRVKG